jgi:hypothetical protein
MNGQRVREVLSRSTALHCVQRQIDNITDAIALGGKLESLLDKLRECETRRDDLRAAMDTRQRIQGQQIDRPKLVAAVRSRLDDWRSLLARRPHHGRQLLREMLAGPITFTPAGRVYRFRGNASFGALLGEAGGTPFVVPVRGFEPRSRG